MSIKNFETTSWESESHLIMQPGEPSWASFKCGGGPHTTDQETVSPYVTFEGPEKLRTKIPNESGNFDIIPERRPVTRIGRFIANLPA